MEKEIKVGHLAALGSAVGCPRDLSETFHVPLPGSLPREPLVSQEQGELQAPKASEAEG